MTTGGRLAVTTVGASGTGDGRVVATGITTGRRAGTDWRTVAAIVGATVGGTVAGTGTIVVVVVDVVEADADAFGSPVPYRSIAHQIVPTAPARISSGMRQPAG